MTGGVCNNEDEPRDTYFPAKAVSSATAGLTSGFGKGPGVTPPLWSRGKKTEKNKLLVNGDIN